MQYVEWVEPKSSATIRIYPDVIEVETASLPATITSHAVEKGAKITDHYRKDLETCTIALFFSSHPIRGDLDDDNPGEVGPVKLNIPPLSNGAPIYTPGGLSSAIGGAIGSLFGGGGGLPKTLDVLKFATDPRERFAAAVETFRRLQTEGILITAGTSFGRFENMGITLATPSRTPEIGGSGKIELQLSQMRFVTSDIASALPLPKEPRGQKKGLSSKAGSNALDGGADSSALKKGTNAVGVTSGRSS